MIQKKFHGFHNIIAVICYNYEQKLKFFCIYKPTKKPYFVLKWFENGVQLFSLTFFLLEKY